MGSSTIDLVVVGHAIVNAGILYAQILCQLLQLTIAASDTGQTVPLMGGKHQLQCTLPCFQYTGGVCENLHIGADRVYTCSNQTIASALVCLHHTDPACADGVDLLHKAKGRNFDICHMCRFQNGGSGRHAGFYAVNFNRYILHVPHPPLTS